MWLFTKVGFFSVVLEEEGNDGDDARLMVRARVGEDLAKLRSTYAPKLSATVEWPGRDYPYRAFITKEEMAEAMVRITLDIDYGNFKSKVAEEQGYDRAHLYGAVWGVMNNAESKLGSRIKKAGLKAAQKPLL
jgi:hypothetical protein